MSDKLSRLKAIGFTLAGTWKKADDSVTFELKKLGDARNVLYAFVTDGEVVYIGKTINTLHHRMQRYKTPAKNSSKGGITNINNHRNIKDGLARGKTIQVFVLPDNGLLQYGGFHVNLAAGLEDSLVRELKPLWNGGKKESPQQCYEPIQDESHSPTS
jgi:hypothetical protein